MSPGERVSAGPAVEPAEALSDLPGLVAGITLRVVGGGRGGVDDFGLSTGGSAWELADRYGALADSLGFPVASVCRQVHGTSLVDVGAAPPAGLWIPGEADGLVGRAAGGLLLVTVADCVPVTVVEPESGSLALLHAGWRGAAAGILPRAIARLAAEGYPASGLRVYLGPAICGDCYEVGPEVPRAFGRRVDGTSHLDIRAELARQAAEAGVDTSRVHRSGACTRCERERYHSHRGDGARAGRMAAYVGWRERRSPSMFSG